jgi:hypothetical protein
MAKGKLTDVIIPEVFNPYLIQRTAELSAIRNSGIAGLVSGITVPSGGKTLNLPFWNDLAGDDEVLDDNGNLTADKITAADDIAAIHTRGKLWKMHELTQALTGEDVMRAIADLIAAWWARQEQKLVLASLQGVFDAASMSDNVLDISAEAGNAALITAESLTDAISLLGDAGGKLTGIITHSAVMYDLAKKKLLDPKITVGSVETAPEMNTYMGRRIIADDGAPLDSGVYTTYLFGEGSIGYAEGTMPVPTATEYDLESGDFKMASRRKFIFHPRGVQWGGTPAKATPSNAELGTGTNWTRV